MYTQLLNRNLGGFLNQSTVG
jgi:hypothetical protein